MRVAKVMLWGTQIGAVSIDEDSQFCSFRYSPQFAKSGIELSPIMMPLSNSIYQFKTLSLESFNGLPGLLSDSIPDRFGNALINAWLISNGRTIDSFNAIERLCYAGIRGMGALEFLPDINHAFNEIEEVEIEQLVELSDKVLNQKENITVSDKNNLKEIIKVGTSAGGARAKAIIAYNEETKEIKSGQIYAGKGFSYWILKLDGVDQKEETSHTRIEYAYYLMAKAAKIEMSESRLLFENNRYHFMTKRFDRIVLEDGKMDKIHMQTLGAMLHIDYNQPGLISYEEVVHLMQKLGLKKEEKEQFFRRMVFNVMARNQDDHVKNISFLMNRKGIWSLSPAYDVTYAFNPNGRWTSKHQMLINGKRSDITKYDLLKSAKSMEIKESKAIEIILDVSNAIARWSEFARESFLEDEIIMYIKNKFNNFD